MIVGILVVYSESYFLNAVEKFEKILSGVSSDRIIVVVSNNPNLTLEREGFEFTHWNNDLSEFGAWQHGINYWKSKNNSESKVCAFVFANDTFCHHRNFGVLEMAIFRNSIKKIADGDAHAIGDVNKSVNKYKIEGFEINYWISTYLFALSFEVLNRLNWAVVPEKKLIRGYVNFYPGSKSIFGDKIDANLKLHIENWLFRKGRIDAWYKADTLNDDNADMFARKATSIICEKWLSVNILRAGFDIVPVFNGFMAKFRKLVAMFF